MDMSLQTKLLLLPYRIDLTSLYHLEIILCFHHGLHAEDNSVLHGNGRPDTGENRWDYGLDEESLTVKISELTESTVSVYDLDLHLCSFYMILHLWNI